MNPVCLATTGADADDDDQRQHDDARADADDDDRWQRDDDDNDARADADDGDERQHDDSGWQYHGNDARADSGWH